jgi:hypothetical protein
MPQDPKPFDEMTSAEKKEFAARLRQEMHDAPVPKLTDAEVLHLLGVAIH